MKQMMKIFGLVLLTFTLSTCSDFIKLTDSGYSNQIALKKDQTFSILFSHNINGETHPCGCRKFPLGGLPQIYGQMTEIRSQHPVIYVDTGDTFFETPIIPDYNLKSARYKAEKLAEAMDELGLRIFVPGDQDFALGVEFLSALSQKHKFEFLMSNATNNLKIKHQKKIEIEVGKDKYVFVSLVDPSLLQPQYKNFFKPIKEEIENIVKTLNPKNKNILLSHAGFEADEKLAQKFEIFDWIIGAHTQTFLTEARTVNKTQIAQVLSRNHYLGELKFYTEDKYELLEIRDEKKDLAKPNPMVGWLDKFKTEYDEILAVEQALLGDQIITDNRIPTYISCSQCHTKQVEFWQETAHSVSFSTLIHAKASNNPSCVKCHSVGLNSPNGFSAKSNMVVSEVEGFDSDKYWEELGEKVKFEHPVRELAGQKRKEIIKSWIKYDQEKKITHNYGNVQCLNCHNQDAEHPFSENTPVAADQMQSKCLNCHSRDQSPEWYIKNEKGLATSLDEKYFAEQLKKVACPLDKKE